MAGNVGNGINWKCLMMAILERSFVEVVYQFKDMRPCWVVSCSFGWYGSWIGAILGGGFIGALAASHLRQSFWKWPGMLQKWHLGPGLREKSRWGLCWGRRCGLPLFPLFRDCLLNLQGALPCWVRTALIASMSSSLIRGGASSASCIGDTCELFLRSFKITSVSLT